MFVLLQIQCINDRTNELKKKKKVFMGKMYYALDVIC